MIDGNSLKRNRFSSRDIGIILCAVLVVALAPTTQSFWIDEGTMGLLSRLPTFSDLRAILDRMNGSEALMPLTATYFWALEKIVGDSEWALRCGNLPWLWLGIVCLALVGKRIDWPWLPLLFAIHPVVWYYADEVRPYAIQLGAGCWLVLGFVQLLQSDGKNTIGLWNFGLASAAIIMASFLGVFVVAAAGVILLLKAITRRWGLTYSQYGILALLATINLLLLLAMLTRLTSGAGGSRLWTVGIANIGFAFYELLGFIGLGPGRETLRSSAALGGLTGTIHLFIPWSFYLGLLFVLYAALFFCAWRIAKQDSAKSLLHLALLAAAVPFVSIACLFGAALESRFPFWGRHLAPTLPFLLLAVGSMAGALCRTWPSRRTALLLIPLFAVLCFSSLEIRFNSRHAKDDYRTAAALAREDLAQGKEICWIASRGAGQYYHLPLSTTWPPEPGTASLAIPPKDSEIKPDVIFVSKSDLFDRQGLRYPWIRLPGVIETTPCPSFNLYQIPSGYGN